MNIFTTFQNKVQTPKQTKTQETNIQNNKPQKMELSAQQIRDRVNLHFNKPTSEASQNEATEEEAELKVPADIGTNDPKSPETQKKLKAALSHGTFNFSAKEKEVLSSILGN
ncbi:MAG: hypothetical protein ACO20H_04165 [Bacteriovoracaceae bacterium]